MFQFRRFPTYNYFIHYTLTDLHLPGCPIRISPDITSAYDSPKLFAVNHVLHRLPVPRHSPCALCSLTFLMRFSKLWVEFFTRWKCNLITLFLLNTVPFQDGRYSILSLVCLALLCSVFKVRFSDFRCQTLKSFFRLNPEFKQKTIAFCLKSKFNSLTRIFGNFARFSCCLLMCFLLLTRSGVQRCMSIHANTNDAVKNKKWWA